MAVVCNLAEWFGMPDEPYRPYYGRRRMTLPKLRLKCRPIADPPTGAWVPYTPSGMFILRLNGPSEASCWRKLMRENEGKGRTELETLGYKVEWVEGATCREYEAT